MNEATTVGWYPIRVTYKREMKLKTYLDSAGISNFLPMRYKEVVESRKLILAPAIHNLIFIQSTRKVIDELKPEVEAEAPMRYIIDKTTNRPIVVPERQMENFIAVAGTYNEQLVYLARIEPTLKKGERVRVTGGIFSGVEGVVVRIKRDQRVLVSIEGIIAVATAFIHPLLLEKI